MQERFRSTIQERAEQIVDMFKHPDWKVREVVAIVSGKLSQYGQKIVLR
jgi:hypothetical protein